MKTFGPLKNRRFPNTVRNHTMSQFGIAKIGVMLCQRFHGYNMPFDTPD